MNILHNTVHQNVVSQNTENALACSGIMVLLLMVLSPLSDAAEVIIVPSSDAAPYVQAQNALTKELATEGHTTQIITLTELVNSPDVMATEDTRAFIAIGSRAAVWLHKRIKPPIILTYCMVSNPKNIGLDDDSSTFGISTNVPLRSQFKLIAEALPKAGSIGILYYSRNDKQQVKDKKDPFVEKVRSNLPKGWRLEAVAIDKYETAAEAIKELFSRDIDIVWTYPNSRVFNKAIARTLLLTSIRKQVPVFGYSLGFVKAGALLGIMINPRTQGTQVAELVHLILTSQNKAMTEKLRIPKYEIALNSIVAEQLSIYLPQKLTKRAKHIIEPKYGR